MSKQPKKYPKSVNGRQCLGSCYEANTSILHPIQLRTYTSTDSFCPTSAYMAEDPVTGKPIKMFTDKCLYVTNNKDELSATSLLTPKSEFTKELFLNMYYDIHSFEQCIEWIANNAHIPLPTQIRVMNASLNVYGNDLELIDDRFVRFFVDYIKRQAVRIYDAMHKNIGLDGKEVLLVDEKTNKLRKDEMQVERINYLVAKFVNGDGIKSFLLKYMGSFKEWDETNDNLEKMVESFVRYIQGKAANAVK